MELYHFTTNSSWEAIEAQGRLYLASPNTDIDKKANESINMPPVARYISFTESNSFDSGYPASKKNRNGKKPTIRIGININDLKEQGQLLGPVDYIGQMDAAYVNGKWNSSGYLKYLQKKGVFRKDKTLNIAAKEKLNENEYRFFSDKPFIDLTKCRVTLANVEGPFTPHWGNVRSRDLDTVKIHISPSDLQQVAQIISTILLGEVNLTRTGASAEDVVRYSDRKDRLNAELNSYKNSIDQEKQDYLRNVSYQKDFVKDVLKAVKDCPKAYKWFDDPTYQHHTFTVQSTLDNFVKNDFKLKAEDKKRISNKISKAFENYDKAQEKVRKDLKQIEAKKLDEPFSKQIADLDTKSQYSYDSKEVRQIIKDHIGDYVSKKDLETIESNTIYYLGKFEEKGGEEIFKKFKQSFSWIKGMESGFRNIELLNALEDWVVEAYKKYGSEYGNYSKLHTYKMGLYEEQKFNLGNLLPLIDKSLTESLRSRFIRETSSGAPIAPSVGISSENRGKLSNLYAQLRDQLKNDFDVQFHNTCILIKTNYPTELTYGDYDREKPISEAEEREAENNEDFDYIPYMASYLKFMQTEGKKIQPLPEIILNKEKQSDGLLTLKTGHYDPDDKILTVYTKDRNPKDVMRSFAHEMEHHVQCLEGRLGDIQTEQVVNDSHLEEIEAEAYQKGNISFRKWTEVERNK